MPKIIKDAKETIINKAGELLMKNGLSDFNMRSIATAAGVAAGTLYNYFPSKEHIVLAVMQKDWETALQKAEQKLSTVASATEGLEIIFQTIRDFSNPYQSTWQSFREAKDYFPYREQFHKTLIDQIADLILPLGKRFDFLFHATVAPFLAEVLLSGAPHPGADFSYLAPCLKKIVGESFDAKKDTHGDLR